MNSAAMHSRITRARDGGALKLHRVPGFGEVSCAPRQPQSTCLITPLPGDWHDTCHNTYLTRARGKGVAALSADGAMSGVSDSRGNAPQKAGPPAVRGGVRNRADRESHALTAHQIANLRAAERHAETVGLPFTRMITLHWEAAGVPLAGMTGATGRFVDLLTKALARHGSKTALLWVHEGGDGKGGHCHILAHVPATLVRAVTGLQRGWLRRITGRPYQARVIHSEPIGGRLGLETGNPDLHAINLEVAFGYLCKGASQEVLDAFGIDRMHEPGGRVIGKRCGTSQNIGTKARKARQAQ